MTRWQLIWLAVKILCRLLFRRDISSVLDIFAPRVEPVADAVEAVAVKAPRMAYDVIKSRLTHIGILVLAFATYAAADGYFNAYDGLTKINKRISGGEGIDIANGVIRATGSAVISGSIPYKNISSAGNTAYLGKTATATSTNAYKGNSLPSATEFGYIKGVTAPVQGQISSAKAAFNLYTSVDRPARSEVATAAQGATADTALQPTTPGIAKDVTAYGAKCDVKVDLGASISSGSTALTLTDQLCYSTDVGKSIVVLNAGAGGGANLVTTVASCQTAGASHVFNLAAAAGTTVTGKKAAYGTDDSAAINSILIAAPACSYSNICPPVSLNINGACYIGSPIDIQRTGVTVSGGGILYSNGIPAIVLRAVGQNPNLPAGYADNYNSKRTPNIITGMTFNGLENRFVVGATAPTNSAAIKFACLNDNCSNYTPYSDNTFITNNTIQDTGVGIDTSSAFTSKVVNHVWSRGNTIINTDVPGSIGINLQYCGDCGASNNYIQGPQTGIITSNSGPITDNHTSDGSGHDPDCSVSPAPYTGYLGCGNGAGSPMLYGIKSLSQYEQLISGNFIDYAKIAGLSGPITSRAQIVNNKFKGGFFTGAKFIELNPTSASSLSVMAVQGNQFAWQNTGYSAPLPVTYGANILLPPPSSYVVANNQYFSVTPDAYERSIGGTADSNAIHGNAASEISALAVKNIPASSDLLLIEDSAASNSKKAVTVGSLPFDSAGAVTAVTTGAAALPISGTVGVNNTTSGFLVTGSATSFTTDVKVGDVLTANSLSRKVIRVADDTNLEVDGSFATTFSGQTATVMRPSLALKNSLGDTVATVGVGGLTIQTNNYQGSTPLVPGLSMIGQGSEGVRLTSYIGTAANPYIQSVNAGGTLASPAATPSGATLFEISGSGHNGVQLINAGRVVLRFRASELFSSSAQGSYFEFLTVNPTTTTRATKAILGNGLVIKSGAVIADDPGAGKIKVDVEVITPKISGITDTNVVPNLHAANSDALGGATFASPGPIGGTIPSTIAGTTGSFSGNITAKTHTGTIPSATTYGATTTIDLSLGDSPSVTLTGNPTLAFSNPVAGQWHILELIQDATGGRTVTWPSTGLICTWRNADGTTTAPTQVTTANSHNFYLVHTKSTTAADCFAR